MRALLLLAALALTAGCSKHGFMKGPAADAAPSATGSGVQSQTVAAPAPQADAGPANLTGTWQGSAEGVSFQLVVQPNGAYSEIQTAGPMMTQQAGVIQAAGPGQIAFVVQDWEPKTQPVYHPTGTTGGYDTQEPVAKPAGGVWRVQFNGDNSLTLQDANLGGIITFSRIS